MLDDIIDILSYPARRRRWKRIEERREYNDQVARATEQAMVDSALFVLGYGSDAPQFERVIEALHDLRVEREGNRAQSVTVERLKGRIRDMQQREREKEQ